jgi:hypothetical protein
MAVEAVFRSPLSSESATSMLRCTKGPEALLAQDPCRAGTDTLLSHLHGPASVRVVLCPPLVRFRFGLGPSAAFDRGLGC